MDGLVQFLKVKLCFPQVCIIQNFKCKRLKLFEFSGAIVTSHLSYKYFGKLYNSSPPFDFLIHFPEI